MIRVLIADDHSMVRQGLKQLLELEKDIKVVAEAGDGVQAINIVRFEKPDIILMDINMPVLSGIDAIKGIRDETPSARIIVLTIHQDREYLFKALQLGASGYVLKDADASVLIEAIRSVNSGQSYIQPSMAKELVNEFKRVTSNSSPDGNNSNNLTKRELEVLKLIAQGLLNKEIAHTLYISEKTVKNHISNIFRKLDVSDRTQAAIYALKHNMIE